MEMLAVKGLTKRYPNFTLDNVTFSLAPGRIMGLIGKNGAGKSTTLKSMLNLVHPDKGSVVILGKDFKSNEESIKQEIGVVLGGIDFYQHKKLEDITAVTKRFYKNWDEASYQKYLQTFSLDPKEKGKRIVHRNESEIHDCPSFIPSCKIAYFR